MLYSLGQHLALLSVRSYSVKVRASSRFSMKCILCLSLRGQVICTKSCAMPCGAYQQDPDPQWQNSDLERWGFEPPSHAALLQSARLEEPGAQIWFGDLDAPDEARGIRVLGTPLGSDAFVMAQLQSTSDRHRLLLDRIPAFQGMQSALLLFLFCAASRATFYLRVCRSSVTEAFARHHDANVRQYLLTICGQET